jgi:hypothetical protein
MPWSSENKEWLADWQRLFRFVAKSYGAPRPITRDYLWKRAWEVWSTLEDWPEWRKPAVELFREWWEILLPQGMSNYAGTVWNFLSKEIVLRFRESPGLKEKEKFVADLVRFMVATAVACSCEVENDTETGASTSCFSDHL